MHVPLGSSFPAMRGSSAANERKNATGWRGHASADYFHRSSKSSSVRDEKCCMFGKAGGLLPLLGVVVDQEVESFRDEKAGSMA